MDSQSLILCISYGNSKKLISYEIGMTLLNFLLFIREIKNREKTQFLEKKIVFSKELFFTNFKFLIFLLALLLLIYAIIP